VISTIPLDRATLCISCNCITESTGDRCNYCGSLGIVNLSRWLNRMEEHEEHRNLRPADVGA